MEFEPDPTIWRYVDLAKFVALISSQKLHFTRIDQFKDKFEGSYPLKNIQEWENQFTTVGDFKNWRKFGCVSCWYQSENESASMWEIYGRNGQGIAIMSTLESLSQSIKDQDYSVIYQDVKYIDFIRGKANIAIPHDAFRYKRIEYENESEYRALICSVPECHKIVDGFPVMGSVDDHHGFPEKGIDLSVDPKILIKKLVLSPYVEDWYEEIVKELLIQYGFKDIEPFKSDLSVDPIYPKQCTI